MAGFLYFLPDYKCPPSGPTNKNLQNYELQYLDGATLSHNQTQSGPEGKPGTVIAVDQSSLSVGGKQPRCGYWPNNQTWAKYKKIWLGYETDNIPCAIDLSRPQRKPGYEITLGSGEKYLVPSQRFLPNQLTLDEQGNVQRVPLPEYADMREQTQMLWQDYRDMVQAQPGGEKTKLRLSEAEQLSLTVKYLQVNYRVGVAECNLLHLWDDSSLVAMLEAIMDIPALEKMLETANADKKKQPAAGG